jgi:hypothetical protein
MIHKYWNVRLHNPDRTAPSIPDRPTSEDDASDEVRRGVRAEEEQVENKVLWIWKSLSTFEERAATCISDMLLHVSNGAYFDGIMAARKFIIHIELFFGCTDDLDGRLTEQTGKGLSYSREAKLLCKKVVSFFQLLSESQSAGMQRLGVTQELLSLVTGLAHYLKLLIRICLQGALKLERETGSSEGLTRFLEQINLLEDRLAQDEGRDPIADSLPYVSRAADSCPVCDKPVEDKCSRKADRVYHTTCMVCKRCGLDLQDNLSEARWIPSTQEILCRKDAAQFPDAEAGFVAITRLQQYVHLLKVAHARLLATLRNTGAIPHTAEDPNIAGYDSSTGHLGEAGPGLLHSNSNSRSRSYNNGDQNGRRGSASYEQTLGDIKRLRSTRMDKQLSNTMKRARSSRIIEGPSGITSQDMPDDGTGRRNIQIEHERDTSRDSQLMFGTQSIALDDIPRLVQAEQAKDQRPNAAKYARGNLVGHEPKVRLVNGHRRDFSAPEQEKYGSPELQGGRPRKYFSELSGLEYFIVRHLAVLSMEPLLEGHFNQQELLDLIETKRPTFWDRFGNVFKNDKAANKKKGVFGKSLEQVVERDGAESTDGVGPGALRVPAVLENAVSAMRNMDMSVEGVFRKNGNIRRLRELSEEIDFKGSESVEFARESPVQVAALLKKFLRELPDPVLTFKLYRLFITAASKLGRKPPLFFKLLTFLPEIQDDDRRRRVLHLSCCLLPKVHRDTMEILFTFLVWVSSFSTVDEESGSKMDLHNLATVIAPNILYANQKSADMDSSFLAIEAAHTMMEYNETMCEVREIFFPRVCYRIKS